MKRRIGTLTALVAVLLAMVAGPAAADSTFVWDVQIDVRSDGSFRVTETITQNFTTSRRGIFRYIPVTELIADNGLVEVPDGSVEDWFQRIRLDDIEVKTSAGAPGETLIERPSRHESAGVMSIRIGEEDTYITGTHTYEIAYTVDGALLTSENGDTVLRWDVVGDGWQQDIGQVHVSVTGSGIKGTEGLCVSAVSFTGTGCTSLLGDNDAFEAEATAIPAYVPISIQVPFDAAQTPASTPILQRRFTLSGALYGDGRVWPLTLFAMLSFLLVGRAMFREGRDREVRGDVTVDGRTDTTHLQYAGGERSRPLFTPRPIPIEFRPPENLRPGELGLIIDERVDPVDVSATIVDLAVRGYLVIEEEQDKTLWWTKTDWTLRETDKSTTDLATFEAHIHNGLFSGRSEVAVSDLKGTFSGDYNKAETALYERGRTEQWFSRRPDKVRNAWLGIGLVTFLFSLLAFGFAIYWTRVALAVVPLIVATLVLLIAHRWMPRRTPKGSELLTRTLGFREFIETAEQDRAQFAEKENLFIEYLPYAVVFGATEKWAAAFADLAILTTGTGLGGWYVWHAGSHGFNGRAFSAGLADFSTSVGSAAVTAPPSSSGGGGGGFSGGGGFGGGGGGSW